MTARFSGKTVAVTGGGTGIGKGAAIAFAAEGAAVVVMGPDKDPLNSTVKAIEDAGGQASAVVGDVTVADDVQEMIAICGSQYGGLDVAFNNAGLMVPGRIADLEEAQWATAMAVATGTWLSMKYEIPAMAARGGGAIVNMCSIIGPRRTIPGTGAYGAAKAAIAAATRAAALESIGSGVRINSVSPGPIETPFSLLRGETPEQQAARMATTLPIGRVGTVDEVVSAVLWLASEDSGFVVGADIVVDGGATT